MNCPRCNGMMFSERLSDFFLTFYAWKCVNCGAVVDRTILLNKKKSSLFIAELTSLPSKGPKV
jgi:transcription elongation factor Elf1